MEKSEGSPPFRPWDMTKSENLPNILVIKEPPVSNFEKGNPKNS